MTWSKGERGWWGQERVEVVRSTHGNLDASKDGTVDLQLIDAEGKPKPAGTPGAVAYFENISETELSRLSPADGEAKTIADAEAASAKAKADAEAAAAANTKTPAGDAK